MSEQKTYDQRVREIAEEMYNSHPEEVCFRWEGCARQHQSIEDFLPAAHIAVKYMAEEFEAGYNYACIPCDDPENGGPYIIFGQESRGLIPTPERKEAGEV